jgi:hypothetical protein
MGQRIAKIVKDRSCGTPSNKNNWLTTKTLNIPLRKSQIQTLLSTSFMTIHMRQLLNKLIFVALLFVWSCKHDQKPHNLESAVNLIKEKCDIRTIELIQSQEAVDYSLRSAAMNQLDSIIDKNLFAVNNSELIAYFKDSLGLLDSSEYRIFLLAALSDIVNNDSLRISHYYSIVNSERKSRSCDSYTNNIVKATYYNSLPGDIITLRLPMSSDGNAYMFECPLFFYQSIAERNILDLKCKVLSKTEVNADSSKCLKVQILESNQNDIIILGARIGRLDTISICDKSIAYLSKCLDD